MSNVEPSRPWGQNDRGKMARMHVSRETVDNRKIPAGLKEGINSSFVEAKKKEREKTLCYASLPSCCCFSCND